MPSPEQRQSERQKYEKVYQNPQYRMKGPRGIYARELIATAPWRGSYLDVGCGRGELLVEARALGYDRVQGVEAVSYLCGDGIVQADAWDLPYEDSSVDVVTLMDVIEHLLPGDDEPTVRELCRVARHRVYITAANWSTTGWGAGELHVNRRPYPEWDELLRDWCAPHAVTWLPRKHEAPNEHWQIDIND